MIVGTPSSMAPELIEGGEGDIRSDLYSLGLILAEMLTGRPPGRDVVADEFDAPVSPTLREVMAKALAHDVEHRFQTPTEMRLALEATPEASLRDE
jgi:serine/threonine protein kinase